MCVVGGHEMLLGKLAAQQEIFHPSNTHMPQELDEHQDSKPFDKSEYAAGGKPVPQCMSSTRSMTSSMKALFVRRFFFLLASSPKTIFLAYRWSSKTASRNFRFRFCDCGAIVLRRCASWAVQFDFAFSCASWTACCRLPALSRRTGIPTSFSRLCWSANPAGNRATAARNKLCSLSGLKPLSSSCCRNCFNAHKWFVP